MSNYALVRILVLWFVIPYASTKVNSHAMKLHPSYGALFSVSYVLCSFMIIFVFWLVASQSICQPLLVLSGNTTCASKLLKPSCANESTIPTYMRYFHAIPSKFVCVNCNFQNEFPFCVPVPLMKRRGVANIFHARYFILKLSAYSLDIARECGR